MRHARHDMHIFAAYKPPHRVAKASLKSKRVVKVLRAGGTVSKCLSTSAMVRRVRAASKVPILHYTLLRALAMSMLTAD